MVSPTTVRRRRRAKIRPSNKATAIAKASRPTMPEPDIYVRDTRPGLGQLTHRAHLRNKGGYRYLCWREGDRVRTYYLGKAPRPSPTPDRLEQLVDVAGAAASRRRARARA